MKLTREQVWEAFNLALPEDEREQDMGGLSYSDIEGLERVTAALNVYLAPFDPAGVVYVKLPTDFHPQHKVSGMVSTEPAEGWDKYAKVSE